MSKFKIGDRVTPNELYSKEKGQMLLCGKTYTVSSIYNANTEDEEIGLEKNNCHWSIRYFDLVEEKIEKPKFKVGDRVTPNEFYFEKMGQVLSRGTVYTVKSIQESGTRNGKNFGMNLSK